MLRFMLAAAVIALAAPAAAQTMAQGAAQGAAAAPAAPQPDIPFASAAEIQALIAKAKAARKPDQPMAPPQPVVRGGGYRALVEYRVAPTPPQTHDKEGELFVVVDGSGTLVLGGTLDNAERINADNSRGTGITGGVAHPIAKGDFIFAPAGTAHHFVKIGPEGLSVVTMKSPIK
jgi:mannose-6-phosphate isomerase-like protein (cupin superfamily)